MGKGRASILCETTNPNLTAQLYKTKSSALVYDNLNATCTARGKSRVVKYFEYNISRDELSVW